MRDRNHPRRLAVALDKASAFLNDFRATRQSAERQGVFHLGETGGIAFETGLPGIEAEALFMDVSDAVETWDTPRFQRLQHHVLSLAEGAEYGGCDSPRDRRSDNVNWDCDWLPLGAAANEAAEALKAGDSHRVALMCGFFAGMMWSDPHNHHSRREFEGWLKATMEDPESEITVPPDTTYQGGTLVDMVVDGYRDKRLELLKWAAGRAAVGHRFSSWYPSEEETLRECLEREDRSVEYAQNFGLRITRRSDDTIRVPHSAGIQRAAALLAVEARKQADNGTDKAED